MLLGSLAAYFQSIVYGAFTPAGGIFAVLTSIGMSVICPPLAAAGVVIASAVTAIVWVATVTSPAIVVMSRVLTHLLSDCFSYNRITGLGLKGFKM
jgi:hypothetical protein